jgi:hypothetical protein
LEVIVLSNRAKDRREEWKKKHKEHLEAFIVTLERNNTSPNTALIGCPDSHQTTAIVLAVNGEDACNKIFKLEPYKSDRINDVDWAVLTCSAIKFPGYRIRVERLESEDVIVL